MFYIFLDIDGVMNDETYWKKRYKLHGNGPLMSMNCYPFNPRSLKNLAKLYKKLNGYNGECKIILSSTWRMNKIDTAIVESRLAEYGMKIWDKTPFNGNRSKEIEEYLNINEINTNYIILDDNTDIKYYFNPDYYCITDFEFGFTSEKLWEAIIKIQNQKEE